MTPLAAIILCILLVGVIGLPRRYALFSMFAGILYLSQNAVIDLGGMSLFPTRILGYALFVRVIVKRELTGVTLLAVDKAFIALHVFITFMSLARADQGGAVYIARLLDNCLTYFAFRAIVQTPEDFKWLLRASVVLLVPYVGLLAIESFTNRNLFTFVGHSRKLWLREGTPRCFGSFRHPSLLGSVGACFLPIFIGLARDPKSRTRAIIGIISCLGFVGFSNSGGPASVAATAFAGWVLWPMRRRMKLFRRGLVLFLCVLAVVMKAPIWYLASKISGITGGSGWHRSRLMEVAFENFDKWWLVGMPVEETAGWMPYNLGATGGADITNQFIAYGLGGGIWAMALFIFVIYRGFSTIGSGLERARETATDPADEAFLWGIGVALAAHVSNWIGITYYDQFNAFWLLQFAVLVTLSEFFRREPAPVAEEAPEVQTPGADEATVNA